MDDPRIQAALQRGLITQQQLATVRTAVPPHEVWAALCQRVPQLAALNQSTSAVRIPADSHRTVMRDPRASSASDVAPTVIQQGSGSGRVQVSSSELRQRAVQAFQQARSEDPKFMPHADLVLQPISELGRGGMGVVHRVRDDRLGREAALKLLSPEHAGSSAATRFMREAELTACLDHPAIPPIYEAGTLANGQPFLLMKVIEGRPFSEVLRAAGQRPSGRALRELLEVLVKVGEAVAHAHGRGILHRDLKPSNVMVGELGEVMLVDWGLARRTDEEDLQREAHAGVSEGLTQAGAVLGTPGYLPPEQADGQRVDERADVFALGAILTEILTGKPPVKGASALNKIAATLQNKIQAPRDRRRDVPLALDAIARCALAPEAKDRTQTAGEFVADLRAYLADEPVSVYREGTLARAKRWARHHPAAVAVAAVTVAGGLVFGGVAATLWSQADKERQDKERAEAAEDRALDAKREAEAAQQEATAQRDAAVAAKAKAARLQKNLQDLLDVARLPTEGKAIRNKLTAFDKQISDTDPSAELMLRQLARIYLLRKEWKLATGAYMRTARVTPASRPPPWADVFLAYALHSTRIDSADFFRHHEGRPPYFGDLNANELNALAERGWLESSGFPAFTRALAAVSDSGGQDLELAHKHLLAAVERVEAQSDPGAKAAVRILQSHLAFHRALASAGAGRDPSAELQLALDAADAAIATQAYRGYALFLRAMILAQLITDTASGTRAARACEEALSADPTLGIAYLLLEQIHQRVGSPPLVLENDYSAALRFRPEDGQLHHWRGQLRLQLAKQNAPPWGPVGWGQRAEEDFLHAVGVWDDAAVGNGFNVGQLNSRVELANAHLIQRDVEAALEVLREGEVKAENAGNGKGEAGSIQDLLSLHANILLDMKRVDAAGARVDALLKRYPHNPNGHYFAGRYHLLRGDRASADAALKRLVELAGDSPMARDLRTRMGQ